MSEPTPGPWRKCGGMSPAFTAVVDANDRYIVFDMADGLTMREHGKPIIAPPMEEQQANARLIAAAPDLLAQLQDAKNWLLGYPHREHCNADTFIDLIENIDAAIAKATSSTEEAV